MKPAQWTAVLILALMVGGISFVSVYLGSIKQENVENDRASLPSLTFPIKSIPREGEKVQTTEVHQSGHQDFWFVNENEREVAVGLNAKGCTCSEVELTVAPPEWLQNLARSAVLTALQQPPRGLDNLTLLAVVNDRQQQFPELPNAGGTMLSQEFSTTVPTGAVGRIRISWRQEAVKALATYAELWMGQRGGSVSARLEVGVRISPPLEVYKELTIPAISERELESQKKTKNAWIICYSLTRPSFKLKADILHGRLKPKSDPLEVGEPIPLSRADLQRLEEKQEAMHRLTILSGYRIPVRVRATAEDGTPMEWGRFHRVVQLSSLDEGIEPTQVQVTGEVLGDISVGGNDELGTINLGPFLRPHGIKRSIVLQTDEKGIDLELDTEHMPNYLKATLNPPHESAGGHRSWVLNVEVPPNAARGEFPYADNPDYRDSAIYVKTKGGKSGRSLRSIRIPVRGVANDG